MTIISRGSESVVRLGNRLIEKLRHTFILAGLAVEAVAAYAIWLIWSAQGNELLRLVVLIMILVMIVLGLTLFSPSFGQPIKTNSTEE